MNREGDRGAQKAPRCQKQPKAQQQSSVLKKKRIPSTTPSDKDAHGGSSSRTSVGGMDTQAVQRDTGKEVKPEREKRPANVALCATTECQPNPGAQRKLSDASNASEDLSKDSGCVSGKLSSSDSSSEISDCPSEVNNKVDHPSDTDLSWIDGKAYVSPDSSVGGKEDDNLCTGATQDNATFHSDAENNLPGFGGCPGVFGASGAFITGELIMGETTEDLVREVEDLRSENEYLKDELEELRCEMLEMRDMFQEEEVYQLQELRVQLDQANKMCRILHYRLRKAERRSIRVAQTGQVDGELVRTLEHDIKVAKSVSLRLHNELESVQKKSSQLEWENEGLRERTQELEVAKQVLQTELEKARESTLKRKGARSPPSKAEKRLSQQIEDDSADVKCQLHFAKEELALMCKKLTKLVSESESMREELAKYHSAYGDIDANQSPEGKANSAHAREAEVKVHLRLVEEEATLLSRRIVELEVENRGLRAEMSDLRERIGGGGEEEVEEQQEVLTENLSLSAQVRDREGREQDLKTVYIPVEYEQGEEGKEMKEIAEFEGSPLRGNNQTQVDGMFGACQITREGPVGGEWDPADSRENDADEKGDRGLHGLTVKDYEALLALRDHSCIVSSALQLLTIPSKNGHCSSHSSPYISPTEVDSKAQLREQDPGLQGPLNEALELELLQTMLLAFIGRVEKILTGGELGGPSLQKDGNGWNAHIMSLLPGGCAVQNEDTQNVVDSMSKQESVEDLRTMEVKERAKQARLGPPSQWHLTHSCRDPKMRLTLQILWVLHHWCQVKGPGLEGKEVRDETMSVLQGLMGELGAELQDEGVELDTEAKATQGKITECAVNSIIDNGRYFQTDRKRHRLQFPPCGSNQKNWCYLSQEAAQLDREDPTKTWDHPIMPLSFPDLDFDQISTERSRTAPEQTALRIYYSPPSARRVQLAQLRQCPIVTDRDSVSSASPWCTPPSSFSPLCLGLSANMSDDMKEMTAGLRQSGHSGSLERTTGRFSEGWAAVEVTCSGTQTHMRPQMVSVGLQTDGPQSVAAVRNSPTRILHSSSSLVSVRNHHISTSLERVAGRVERPKPTSTSPRLYRRHSTSCSSSFHSSTTFSTSTSSSSSSASAATTKERALWNLSPQGRSGVTWARPTNTRAGAGHNHITTLNSEVTNSGRSIKPPSKPAGTNRCGLVTEFLRRVSGRADKPVPTAGQKGKSSLKTMERVPSRPPGVSLHRNDSVTRIVNQRFMKQREEAGRVQKEEKGSSQNQAVRGNISRDQSLSTITAEDRSYDCSSSSTLTFCFARPSRSTQRHASNQSKLHRHATPVVGGSGDASCE